VFTQLAMFKAGDKRKIIHQHLFLPKEHLTTDWEAGAVDELNLKFLGMRPLF